MEYISITEKFNCSVEHLFAFLEKHENLELLFVPMKVNTIKKGNPSTYGLGSVRSLQLAIIPPFEETITVYKKDELIEYKITKGSPLKNHHGIMKFSGKGNESTLLYTIEFESSIPLLAPLVKMVLANGIEKGLKKLKKMEL